MGDSTNINDTDNEYDEWFVFWIIFSFMFSLIFAKSGRGLYSFMFGAASWVFLWLLVAQVYEEHLGPQNYKHLAFFLLASLIGWFVGTFVIWKSKKLDVGFFEF